MSKRLKKQKRFKREYIEKVKQFHLKCGWKPRRARLDAIGCFEADLESNWDNNIQDMIDLIGFGKDLSWHLRHEVFCCYWD